MISLTIKQLLDEDFVNYKKPSMFIAFPKCTWKCEIECGEKLCQNKELALSPDIEIAVETIIERYKANAITQALVLGGLEPFDSWQELCVLMAEFRKITNDDIVIYTGYTLEEKKGEILFLQTFFNNIIIKFGRFVPNQKPHYDEVLGIKLASDNQYAVRIC